MRTNEESRKNSGIALRARRESQQLENHSSAIQQFSSTFLLQNLTPVPTSSAEIIL